MEKKYILAIESSCDETSAAVVVNGREVLSNIIASQIDTHKKFKYVNLCVIIVAISFTGLPYGWGTGKDDVMAAVQGRYELYIFIWQHIGCNETRAAEHA